MGDAHSDAAGHEEAVWFWRIVGAFLAAHELAENDESTECGSRLFLPTKQPT